MGYHKKGKEYLDDTPISLPAGFKRPESIHDMIKRYIRSEAFRAQAEEAGVDTEEEANDFEIEDEEESHLTRHEFSAMAADELRELEGEEAFRRAKQQLQDEYEKRMMGLHADFGVQPREKEQVNGNQKRSGGEDSGGNVEGRAEAGGNGAGDATEKRDAPERKGRSAGKRRGGVSEGS